jgi:hypothetical protein
MRPAPEEIKTEICMGNKIGVLPGFFALAWEIWQFLQHFRAVESP